MEENIFLQAVTEDGHESDGIVPIMKRGVYSFSPRLSHLTIDHVSLLRRSKGVTIHRMYLYTRYLVVRVEVN